MDFDFGSIGDAYDSYAGIGRTAAAGISLVSSLISLAAAVLIIVALWKIFDKAGKPGWHALIPFLNIYDLIQICWTKKIAKAVLIVSICGAAVMFVGAIILGATIGSSAAYNLFGFGGYAVLERGGAGVVMSGMLIGLASIALCVAAVFMIIAYVKLGQAFGKSGGFLVGLVLLSVVFLPILAFGQARYQGYWDDEGYHPDPNAGGQNPYGGQQPYGGQTYYGQTPNQQPYGQAPGQTPYGQAPYGGQPVAPQAGMNEAPINEAPANEAPVNSTQASSEIPEPPRYCSGCGTQIQPGSKFCVNCGKQFGV